MDFVGLNEISFVTTGASGWKISTLKLNGLEAYDKSLIYNSIQEHSAIYCGDELNADMSSSFGGIPRSLERGGCHEKPETVSSVLVSPINKNEYLALIINGKQGILKHINIGSSKEDVLLEVSLTNTEKIKLAVSPKGSYAYLLHDDSLVLFDISLVKQFDKIDSVKSAVWVGDGHLLFSNTEGISIYNLKNKEKSSVSKTKQVSALAFNPKENGIIAFDENGKTTVVGCQTWQIINSKQGAEFKTLTSEKTAINKKGDQFGYWRFKDKDWVVKILEDKSKFVTVWQRY